MTAAVLALSLTACGSGNSDGNSGSGSAGGKEPSSSAQNVYSSEEVVLNDEEGMLEDMSVEGLTYCNGRLYAKGFSFGDNDSGSHILLNFAPDGSDLQYTMLMGSGMEDVIATSVGPDGNFYIARVSYSDENFEFSTEGVTFDEHASAEEPGSDDITVEEAEGGEIAPGGPETAEEDSTADGPVPFEEEEEDEDPDMEEFITEGGDSPAGEEEYEEDAEEGVTSPLDEYKDEASAANAENELTVTDVEEVEDMPYEEGSSSYALTCIAPDGQELWSAAVRAPEDPDADFFINSIACSEDGILVSGSFAGLYAALYSVDKAAGIQPENFIVLALISMACNAVRCHAQIKAATQTIRLNETISELKSASRRDGLTGLLNRLALEDDASTADGRQMTAYMIDINYFKEFNDQYGHAAGDTILREVSGKLKQLYPGAHYYRYGGDEFLVLTYKAPEENYGSDTYDFRQEKYGVTVDLSIGNAQGSPSNYQEVFDLISKADKALYITKQRTHSAEYGGHDRRK